MKKLLSAFLLFASFHLAAQPALTTDSLRVDGNFRSFHFVKPKTAQSGRSLVFVLHGSGGNGRQMANATALLESKAESENFIAVYPDGYKKFWNECRKAAGSEANLENIDEISFFEAMIDYFKQKHGIDERRVFAVGTSGGGHMVYKLAMMIPEKFRAVAAIIANLPDEKNMDCEGVGTAIPIMIINGTNDQVNPYNGGEVRAGNFSPGTVRSTDETFRYWSRLAGYTGAPTKERLSDADPSDGKIIERYTYSTTNKPDVVLLKVIGGKHDYPNDIDVHLTTWEFFETTLTH